MKHDGMLISSPVTGAWEPVLLGNECTCGARFERQSSDALPGETNSSRLRRVARVYAERGAATGCPSLRGAYALRSRRCDEDADRADEYTRLMGSLRHDESIAAWMDERGVS